MISRKNPTFDHLPRIARADARAQGLSRYFTGAPCPMGHVAPRYSRNCKCVVCAADNAVACQRARKAADPAAEALRLRRQRWNDPVGALLIGTRCRAKRRGILFSISRGDLVMGKDCPCCGREFDMRHTTIRPGPRDSSPSIDRIKAHLGYVPGNVAVICWRCNEIKRNATVDELRTVLRWMEETTSLRLVG